jgi:MFS family permease
VKKKLFYGWWIVISCVVMSIWAGGINYGITSFVNPIVQEFGWTYFAVSLAASFRSVEMGILAPVTGFLADKFGSRRVAFAGGLICGIGLMMLSATQSLAMFYAGFIVLAVGLSGGGQSVTTTAVANWFKKHVGRATGFAVAGYGIGGLSLPFIAWLVVQHGWRTALVILAIATWLIILPTSLVLRHKPEQYGYSPDGEGAPPATTPMKRSGESTPVTGDATAKSAIRTKAFWLLAMVFAIQQAGTQTVTFHIMPFTSSLGIIPAIGAVVAMFIPLSSVVGRLSLGWLSDSFGKPRMLIICFLLQSVGLVILSYGSTLWHLAAFVLLFGPAFGGGVVLRAALVRTRFGRSAFGSIQGLVIGAMTVGGLIGPSLAGAIYDARGSYQLAWLILAAASLTAALAVMIGKNSLTVTPEESVVKPSVNPAG